MASLKIEYPAATVTAAPAMPGWPNARHAPLPMAAAVPTTTRMRATSAAGIKGPNATVLARTAVISRFATARPGDVMSDQNVTPSST